MPELTKKQTQVLKVDQSVLDDVETVAEELEDYQDTLLEYSDYSLTDFRRLKDYWDGKEAARDLRKQGFEVYLRTTWFVEKDGKEVQLTVWKCLLPKTRSGNSSTHWLDYCNEYPIFLENRLEELIEIKGDELLFKFLHVWRLINQQQTY